MKKTFLSLAFVLSISISASFAAEIKPVVGESKTGDDERITPVSVSKKAVEVSSKTIKAMSITDCFIVSCGTQCFTHETPLTGDQSLHIWQYHQDMCDAQEDQPGPDN